jgi:hypothetical protein
VINVGFLYFSTLEKREKYQKQSGKYKNYFVSFSTIRIFRFPLDLFSNSGDMDMQQLVLNFLFFLFLSIILQVFSINNEKLYSNCLDNKPYFYIYEWPLELHEVYPPANATLHKDSSYDHSFNENGGAGRMLVPDVGLFQTWQFSLYKNVMSRLRASPQRTR